MQQALTESRRRHLGSSLDWALWRWKTTTANGHVAHWAHSRACFRRFRRAVGNQPFAGANGDQRMLRLDHARGQWLLDRTHAVAVFARSQRLARAMASLRRETMLQGASSYLYARSSFAIFKRQINQIHLSSLYQRMRKRAVAAFRKDVRVLPLRKWRRAAQRRTQLRDPIRMWRHLQEAMAWRRWHQCSTARQQKAQMAQQAIRRWASSS
eukprot:3916485-Prymnesium_polylepis.1